MSTRLLTTLPISPCMSHDFVPCHLFCDFSNQHWYVISGLHEPQACQASVYAVSCLVPSVLLALFLLFFFPPYRQKNRHHCLYSSQTKSVCFIHLNNVENPGRINFFPLVTASYKTELFISSRRKTKDKEQRNNLKIIHKT